MRIADFITIGLILFAAGGAWMGIRMELNEMRKDMGNEATARAGLKTYIEKQLTKISQIYLKRIKSLEDQIKKHDEILMQLIKKKIS